MSWDILETQCFSVSGEKHVFSVSVQKACVFAPSDDDINSLVQSCFRFTPSGGRNFRSMNCWGFLFSLEQNHDFLWL